MNSSLVLAAVAGAALLAGPASALTTVTVEAAGVQTTTIAASTGVETFDGLGGYTAPYATSFGGSIYAGSFDAVLSSPANVYGGAGGSGRYAIVQTTQVLTLTGAPTNYFGLWASALDGGNAVEFYKGGVLVDSIDLVDYPLGTDYRGNPTAAYSGQNGNEKYAFFNFVVSGGYDEVHLVENGGGGFELDNVTVGSATVPEPATWGLMIAGFAMTGFAARRRRIAAAA